MTFAQIARTFIHLSVYDLRYCPGCLFSPVCTFNGAYGSRIGDSGRGYFYSRIGRAILDAGRPLKFADLKEIESVIDRERERGRGQRIEQRKGTAEREEIGGKHERERKIVVNYTVHVHVVCSSISSFWLPTVIISPDHGRKATSRVGRRKELL